jgi:hypothetical protein
MLVHHVGPPSWSTMLDHQVGPHSLFTLLVHYVSSPCYFAMLVHDVSPPYWSSCWSTVLVHGVGPPYRSTMLVRNVGPQCWSTLVVHRDGQSWKSATLVHVSHFGLLCTSNVLIYWVCLPYGRSTVCLAHRFGPPCWFTMWVHHDFPSCCSAILVYPVGIPLSPPCCPR